MKYKFPHVALQIMNELASKNGDCSQVLIAVAKQLGFAVNESPLPQVSKCPLPEATDFQCGSRTALGLFANQTTVDAVTKEVAKRELHGKISPCNPDNSISCYQNCPLLMDLFLQSRRMDSD